MFPLRRAAHIPSRMPRLTPSCSAWAARSTPWSCKTMLHTGKQPLLPHHQLSRCRVLCHLTHLLHRPRESTTQLTESQSTSADPCCRFSSRAAPTMQLQARSRRERPAYCRLSPSPGSRRGASPVGSTATPRTRLHTQLCPPNPRRRCPPPHAASSLGLWPVRSPCPAVEHGGRHLAHEGKDTPADTRGVTTEQKGVHEVAPARCGSPQSPASVPTEQCQACGGPAQSSRVQRTLRLQCAPE